MSGLTIRLGSSRPEAFPGLSLVALLDGRRGRAEDANRSAQAGIFLRGGDGMVERRLGLVVRRIVAFVRHDQTDVWQGGEQAPSAAR